MPFTFAHPALVLPLTRSRYRLSLTGLVAGSMVPDFEFILRMKVDENIGHHWPGVFVFDLPMALIMCFGFHLLLRNPLIQNLPGWYRDRFSSYSDFNWNQYAAANSFTLIASVILGISSHFLWDAFTHDDGGFVLLFPFFRWKMMVFYHALPVYTILQVISSVWGLWMVHQFIKAMPAEKSEFRSTPGSYSFWWIILLVGMTLMTGRLMIWPEHQTFWDLFFATMGSCLYALIFTSFGYRKWKWAISKEQ